MTPKTERERAEEMSDHDLLIRVDQRVCHLGKILAGHLAHHWAIEVALVTAVIAAVVAIIVK